MSTPDADTLSRYLSNPTRLVLDLRLEDGQQFGDVAEPWQREHLLGPVGPCLADIVHGAASAGVVRRHQWRLPRGADNGRQRRRWLRSVWAGGG